MKSLEKLTFTHTWQTILTYIFYSIFAIFSIYNILQAEQTSTKVFFFLILIIILGLALYAQHIKNLYRKSIQTIAFDLDPEKAKEQFDLLLKKDRFHSYKNERKIFDTLYYVDQMEFETCLKELEENHKFFHSSIDQLLIYHYTRFLCLYMTGQNKEAQSEYQKLVRMKDTKVKGAKVSPLYNWELMEAIYRASQKDYKQSYNLFKTVNTKNMNPREKVQYYYHYSLVAKKLRKPSRTNEILSYHGKSETWKRSTNL